MADDGINDQVELRLGDESVLISTGYDIRQAVLSQPGDFSLRLGQSDVIQPLIKKLPPNTPFELRVADRLRMTGRTDGYRANGTTGSTELSVFGRDSLAPMHDAHIVAEKSFNDATYSSLVTTVMKEVGLDPSLLVTGDGNRVNRRLMSGVPIKELLPIRTIDQILADVGSTSVVAGKTTVNASDRKSLQSKIGERWYEFVRKHLDRAGLMLWAGCDGKFILTAPNANTEPAYRILRRRRQLSNSVNVISADLLNDTRPRYSYAVVYGRSGGRAAGRSKSKGDAVDREMIDFGFGNPIEVRKPGSSGASGGILPIRVIDEILANQKAAQSSATAGKKGQTSPANSRAMVIRDAICQNPTQAAYLASRKLAESRRHGYQLVYTLAGHSTPSLLGGRAVWTPDTTVEVVDDEFGIDDIFWIESVEMRRNPATTTTIRLMRPADVIFGSAEG